MASMQIESRRFNPFTDVEACHQLIADCWRTYGPKVTFHVGDLHWRLRPQPDQSPESDIRLWYRSDRLLAFAWFDPIDSGDILCHPDVDRQSLEPELLAWLEDKAQESGASSLTIGSFNADSIRKKLLSDRGYEQQSDFLHHLELALENASTAIKLPAGYTIKPTAPEDLSSLASTVALAFQSRPKPVSTYQSIRASRFYRNDLDLIVKADGGEVVAFCIAWLDEKNNVGLLEPVGCHPKYRRQGLATTVVAAALEALRTAGAKTVVVYPFGGNPIACALYKKCGFLPVGDDYDWKLTF